ncbi:Proline dehydrogenase 1, mitochondrial [Trichinella murrelli]|uniref:Proline dehydrogenase n=1 Tax=Trichinella murrelli TaxID=144512 RepID=A0A0V0TQ24_9BILA|nr:Proline dehydrogenase 1, mitochondrial [Trichinella murrelli]
MSSGSVKLEYFSKICKNTRRTFAVLSSGGLKRNGTVGEVKFDDSKIAFGHKTKIQLLRSMAVLKLCSTKMVLDRGEDLFKILRWTFGDRISNSLMKATFYGHFVAGENLHDAVETVKRLKARNVRSLLDYCFEQTLDNDSDGSVEECTLKTLIGCIDALAGLNDPLQMVAIKLTSLGCPKMLLTLSDSWTRTLTMVERRTGLSWENLLESPIAADKFNLNNSNLRCGDHQLTAELYNKWLDNLRKTDDGLVDLYPYGILDRVDAWKCIKRMMLADCGMLDDENLQWKYEAMVRRLNEIVDHAVRRNVRIVVDAEQSYFLPMTNILSLELMRKYCKNEPVVFITYQAYLKQANKLVANALQLARRWQCVIGTKLVRGAYMEHERQRALLLGYPSPINDTYDLTNETYDNILDLLIKEINSRQIGKVHLICATHNEQSVKHLLANLKSLQLHSTRPTSKCADNISFGQLYGMCDQISFPLADAGFLVYKYLPFGPVGEVLPYLLRRAQENSAVMEKTQFEYNLMKQELKRRLFCIFWLKMENVPKESKANVENDDDSDSSAVTAIIDDDLATSDDDSEIIGLNKAEKEIPVCGNDNEQFSSDSLAQCPLHPISLESGEAKSDAESEETSRLIEGLLDEYPTLGECSLVSVHQTEREVALLEDSLNISESVWRNDTEIQWVEDAKEVMEFLEMLGVSRSDEQLPELSVEQIEMFLNE